VIKHIIVAYRTKNNDIVVHPENLYTDELLNDLPYETIAKKQSSLKKTTLESSLFAFKKPEKFAAPRYCHATQG